VKRNNTWINSVRNKCLLQWVKITVTTQAGKNIRISSSINTTGIHYISFSVYSIWIYRSKNRVN